MLPDFTSFLSPCVLLAPPKTSILHAFHTRFLTRAKHLRALGKPDFRLRSVHVKSNFEGSVVELEKKPVATIQQQRFSSYDSAATQIQQQRNFSSWRLATQTSSSPRKFRFSRREARFFVQETPPVEIRKDFSCVQGRFRTVTVGLRELAPCSRNSATRLHAIFESLRFVGTAQNIQTSRFSHQISHKSQASPRFRKTRLQASQFTVSMAFRVVRTNQYNQDLGLIHSTNGDHLESPNEGSSIDHQVTIHLHAQNITMFPTNETWKVPLEEFDEYRRCRHPITEPRSR
ncbi:hypothetical protein F511_35063 [Dorcoceras hygrometricum]|uniref:Uncharacterized protein n=1 Tax=Dorcoceras hygrometricum TaxID=472368 RepID=A0A2Z7AF65_9LAMI|nr:hypothetical protein F511_35063 [Dorcoceras hygrometricum]